MLLIATTHAPSGLGPKRVPARWPFGNNRSGAGCGGMNALCSSRRRARGDELARLQFPFLLHHDDGRSEMS